MLLKQQILPLKHLLLVSDSNHLISSFSQVYFHLLAIFLNYLRPDLKTQVVLRTEASDGVDQLDSNILMLNTWAIVLKLSKESCLHVNRWT